MVIQKYFSMNHTFMTTYVTKGGQNVYKSISSYITAFALVMINYGECNVNHNVPALIPRKLIFSLQ